jgi:hypothetical protein|tara:strand:+ start:8141 stop:9367 length:1227 start_codon:yes stop_codon:yes gene_type:complete
MGIRELREELASPTGWTAQATTMIGRQWKLEDAAINALVAKKTAHAASTQDMLKTRYDKTATIVEELAKAVEEDGGANAILGQRLDTQIANLSRIEAAWATSLGYSPQQVLSEGEVIFGLVDQINKEPGEFAKKGTWNKSTLDLINKKFTQLGMTLPDPKMAQVLWEGRVKVEGYKGTALPGQASAGGSASKLINRYSLAGAAAEALGVFPDFLSEAWEGISEVSRAAWEFDTSNITPMEGPATWGDRGARDFLSEAFGVENENQRLERILRGDESSPRPAQRIEEAGQSQPTVVPTDQSTKMGPFAILDKFTGTEAGLIDGHLATEEMDSPLAGIDESTIGKGAVEELRAINEKANELSRDAAEFVRNLEAYMKEYGQDKAIRLMAGEWDALSDSEKQAVEEHLQRK